MTLIKQSVITFASVMTQMALMDKTLQSAIETQSIWELRQHRWEAKWGNVEDCSELYRRLADLAMAGGYSDLTNAQPWFLDENWGQRPLKRIAEDFVGHKLPDINPKLCLEFARETPFSAENWYNGCTGEWL